MDLTALEKAEILEVTVGIIKTNKMNIINQLLPKKSKKLDTLELVIFITIDTIQAITPIMPAISEPLLAFSFFFSIDIYSPPNDNITII